MKKIVLLGSTGSIGKSVLDIVQKQTSFFSICGLSCYKNTAELKKQITMFSPDSFCVVREDLASGLEQLAVESKKKLFKGISGLNEMLKQLSPDLVVCAISGYEGIYSMLEAIRLKLPVAVANKEPLVIAGKIVSREAKKNLVPIYPIDSEHNAIFQCLHGQNLYTENTADGEHKKIRKIILTASGGPFWNTKKENFVKIQKKEALQHPQWSMGEKNTVDSASMMNKALEVVEAHWLFGLDLSQIEVWVHPQSILHGIVQFRDGSSLAQMALPDMRVAIAYCLGLDLRVESSIEDLDLTKIGKLEFFTLDEKKFPAVKFIKECSSWGEGFAAAMNGVNEALVKLFLEEKIRFFEILDFLAKWMEETKSLQSSAKCPSFLKQTKNLEDALAANQWGLDYIRKCYKKI